MIVYKLYEIDSTLIGQKGILPPTVMHQVKWKCTVYFSFIWDRAWTIWDVCFSALREFQQQCRHSNLSVVTSSNSTASRILVTLELEVIVILSILHCSLFLLEDIFDTHDSYLTEEN